MAKQEPPSPPPPPRRHPVESYQRPTVRPRPRPRPKPGAALRRRLRELSSSQTETPVAKMGGNPVVAGVLFGLLALASLSAILTAKLVRSDDMMAVDPGSALEEGKGDEHACRLQDPLAAQQRMVYVTNNLDFAVALIPASARLLTAALEAAPRNLVLQPRALLAFYGAPGDAYRAIRLDGAPAVEDKLGVEIAANTQTHFFLGPPNMPLNQSLSGFVPTPRSGVAAKFRNYLPHTVKVYWVRNSDRAFIEYQVLAAGEEVSISSYEGDVFAATSANAPGDPDSDANPVLTWLPMKFDQVVYGIGEGGDDAEMQFLKDYHARNSVHWLHNYPPRGPATWPFWDCSVVGTTFTVPTAWTFHESCRSHATCTQEFGGTSYASASAAGRPIGGDVMNLQLRVLSSFPKVLQIDNFLSAFEADHIISFAKGRSSTTYGSQAGTEIARTSTTSWLNRSQSAVADVIFRRIADVVGIPQEELHPTKSAEDMQIVHYAPGQAYLPHHDWVIQGKGPETRFLTLLLYLTDRPGTNGTAGSGGTTDFPKAFGGAGLSLHPERGTAVLFYDMLEDGNVDDLSLHGAAAVNGVGAEKFLSNVWIWDPKR